MLLNLHRKLLCLYVSVGNNDGFRKIDLFEDFDETFINFSIDSDKKYIEYFCQTEVKSIEKKITNFENPRNNNTFKDQYFAC